MSKVDPVPEIKGEEVIKEVEEDEKFEVKLYEVEGCPLDLEGSDKSMNALVTIIDDDEPGEVGFLEEHLQISVLESQGFVDVPVTRQNGSAGAIKIKYTTVDGSAIAASADGPSGPCSTPSPSTYSQSCDISAFSPLRAVWEFLQRRVGRYSTGGSGLLELAEQ